ncbi:hypothetical protein JCM15457_250 [Liquorilactobacillus sucicola DSM 21376 = JCM 15457]|uniref:YfhO family protein n=1 Tax=Liquorilactobacillus sucicola DSM 21376 = JCM 15457 TaxID=1423806 RepID=A0A023CUW7_9LACO|nr:hypothetical protein [Liquorilactobacillus sucicola]KRN05320.1 hypothetical protein FD15_GL001871 [Liquorilactobacillus sucicola DSM 21376 = JCM 15457]GAJ25386.1 hypothetical protein JCM15457_250 [Liquorilactobacillus sucicola DSM 21376 = JCM 15457]
MLVQLFKKGEFRCFKLFLFYLLLSFVIMLPLLTTPGFFGGWDQSFHLNRITDLTATLRQLHPVTFINTTAFSQIGLAVNTFYPYLTLLPFAILHLLIPDLILSVYLGLTILLFTSFTCAHIAMARFSEIAYHDNSLSRPVIFAIVYSLSGYFIFNLVVRFDLGECLVMMSLPLFAVGLYEVLLGDWQRWYWLALSAIIIAYSHILSTVVIAFLSLLIILCSAFSLNHRSQRWKALLKVFIVVLGSTLFLLVPLITTAAKISVTSPKLGSLSKQAMTGFAAIALSAGNVINPKSATHGVNLGVIILAAIIIGTIFIKSLSKIGKIMYVCGMIAFFLCTFLFPWQLFDHSALKILQHPWRLLIFVNLFMAGCLGDWLTLLKKRQLQIFCLALMIIVTIFTNYNYTAQTPLRYPKDQLTDLTLHTKYMDYEPVRSNPYLHQIEGHQGTINGRKYFFKERTPVPDGIIYNFPATNHEEKIDVPFLDYGNLVVTAQNVELPSHTSRRGTVAFSVPSNINSVAIHYQVPTAFKAAALLSLLSISMFLVLWFRFMFRQNI